MANDEKKAGDKSHKDESPNKSIWATPLPTRGQTKSASEADLTDHREWPGEPEDATGGKSSSIFLISIVPFGLLTCHDRCQSGCPFAPREVSVPIGT